MNPDLIPRPEVVSALREFLPFFAIACLILLGGVSSLALWRLRSRERLLLWVGLFSIFYALRLFIQNDLVRDAFNSQGRGYLKWVLCITYLINIPFALFARELLGKGWKGTIGLWLWISAAFAAFAIPAVLLGYYAPWIDFVNSLMVIAGTVLVLTHAWAGRGGVGLSVVSPIWPLLTFGIFVVLENYGFRIAGLSVEPIGFLILLGGFASIAVRRALATERKLIDVEQELSTARRIQSSILPQSSPALPGIRVAARYQPMTAVAGDFYDFLILPGDVLIVLVADVSGHGVPAALVACMLKICFAAQKTNAPDPAAILSGISVMLRGSLGSQYVTAACATIDAGKRTITYAGAGHPPAILWRSQTDEVALLEENGLFIGPFPKATYSSTSVSFVAGDRLLLYTDGITEANDKTGEEFGRERLEQFLMRSPEREPERILDRLFESVTTTSQQDDLTAVLVLLE